jgi:outer membrane protein OmpA-like peptidoglycan-associated protein
MMSTYSLLKAEVTGYASKPGSTIGNSALSKERADVTFDYLSYTNARVLRKLSTRLTNNGGVGEVDKFEGHGFTQKNNQRAQITFSAPRKRFKNNTATGEY